MQEDDDFQKMNRDHLIMFFKHSLYVIPRQYESQDSNRLTLLYFAVSGLDILNALNIIESKNDIINWIYSLQLLPPTDLTDLESAKWGFRGSPFFGRSFDPNGNDPNQVHEMDDGHLAMTYSALCLLIILGDDLSRLNKKAIIAALKQLQIENGSFSATSDQNESDMRFLFCACAISSFLNDWSGVDIEKAVAYILSSSSYDYAFGQDKFQESHGGSTYCAIASLALMNRLGDIGFHSRNSREASGYMVANSTKPLSEFAQGLVLWLTQRQVSGFQGRINKDQDSCYSWWIGASLQILGYFNMVETVHLRGFIMSCKNNRGFSKYPNNSPDVLHTYFSLCGLAFLDEPGLEKPHCSLGITIRSAKRLAHLDL